MATIERRERQSGTVYLADVRIRGFPRQKKTFKRLTVRILVNVNTDSGAT